MENNSLLFPDSNHSRKKYFKPLLTSFTYFFLLYQLFIFYIVNTIVKGPYMDEIFHFPQAIKYYNGHYSEWDPKITTPPGLYFASITVLIPLSKLFAIDLNTIECFRITNVFFSVGNFYLLYKILRKKQKNSMKLVHLISALNMAMLPVLYFFSFLYYTDSGSTFLVLLMYYWHLKNFFFSASLAGALSIFFRQTNIIWVFYVAADETLHTLALMCKEILSGKEKNIKNVTCIQFTKEFWTCLKSNWKEIFMRLVEINSGYLIIATAFICFVFINGSLALGDKDAHQVCVNVPQFFYFLLFCLFFSSPYLISPKKAKMFLKFVFMHKMLCVMAFLICSFCVVHLSHVHPYVLADNRHFTFYVWRRLLGRNLGLSLALIPFYVYSLWSLLTDSCLRKNVFKLLLLFCIFLSVVPQKLLEFRYFILPYIMLRINMNIQHRWQPYLEFLLYTVVNYIVFDLFLFRTFTWESSEETQRFMW